MNTAAPRYLLDTNICIYLINRKPPGVQYTPGNRSTDAGFSGATARSGAG